MCMLLACLFGIITLQDFSNENAPVITGAVVLGVTVALVILLVSTKKMSWQTAIYILFLIGLIVRILYVLYTPYNVRQHDVKLVTSGKGHMGYIQYIATNLALPDTNKTWQFYHPPLHHIIAGGAYRIMSDAGLAAKEIAEKLQFITVFYSSLIMVFGDRLLAACKVSDRSRFFGDLLFALHPTFVLLSGSLNNDCLATALAIASLWFMAEWWHSGKTVHIFLCGLFLGLSMMAKLSGATLAFPFAFAFIWKLVQNRKKWKKSIAQYMIFGLISVPLGMWYPVRNLLKFGQSFTYVPLLSVEANRSQYLENISAAQRTFLIPWHQLASPYQTWPSNSEEAGYNIFMSLFKTSLFGEYSVKGGFWCYILLATAFLLACLALFGLLYIFFKKKDASSEGFVLMWMILWTAIMFSFITFSFQYPFICSMDFRYLFLSLPFSAVFLAKLLDETNSKVLRIVVCCLLGVFAVSSYFVYGIPAVWE